MSFQLPKCLLFDLDGTILDSLPGIEFSIQEACQSVGLPKATLDLRSLLGPPIRVILSLVARSNDPALLDRLERSFRASYDSEGWRKTLCFDGALAALVAMQAAGHRLFVVSNKPRQISIRILEREGLLHLFERIYTRDSQTPPWLSKGGMLASFLSENGVLSSDCLMVGDTMEDAGAAATAGMNFAYMTHGYGLLGNSRPSASWFKFDNFSQLLILVQKEPALD